MFYPCYAHSLLIALGLLVGGFSVQSQSIIRHYESDDYVLEISSWTKEDGLPSWHIFDIIQDQRGFLWLGSDMGLVRFDGRSFTTYTGKAYGMQGNSVGRMAEDVNGKIWLFCSQEGDRIIEVFDPIEEVAIPLKSYINEDLFLSNYSHYGFFRQQDTIWILDPISGKGGRYDGQWEWLLNDTSSMLMMERMNKTEDFPRYYPRKDGLFWAWKTKQGKSDLYVIDHSGKEVSNLNFTKKNNRFFLLDEDLNFYYWPQPQYDGDLDTLFYFDEKRIQTFPYGTYPKVSWGNSICHDYGRFLKINKEGFGLAINSLSSFFFKDDKILFENLSNLLAKDFQTRVTEIVVLIDNETFWFSSPEGLFRMTIKKKLFTTYNHQNNVITSVRGMVGIGDSHLVANTYGGMFQIDLQEKRFSSLPIPDSYQNLGLLKEGNQLWVTKSSSNLVHYDLLTKRYQTFPLKYYQEGYNGYSTHRLNDSVLWVASHLGILAFDEKSESFQPHLLQDTSAYYWYTNDQGVWLGSQYGLFLFDKNGKRKQHFPIIEADKTTPRVYYIHEDEDGLFWLGTEDGLISWHPNTKAYRKYSVKDGLSDNKIHAIIEDSDHCLWLSSNYGLMHFRKSDGYVKTYLEKDGLPSNEFNFLSYFQREDGLLFLGGVNGIISFHPDSMGQYNERAPILEIAKVALYNRNTEEVTNHTKVALETSCVTISPTINRLEVSLVPHYLTIDQMVYEWRMPKDNDQWKPMTEPRLMFNNPVYGRYLLEFRAYPLGNQTLKSNILALELFVLKPIYLRWWFIALLAMITIGGFWGYFRLRQFQLKRRNEELEQEVNDRTLELREKLVTIDLQSKELRQIDEMKSRFFINISHELRTPLSMILGPVNSLSQQPFPPEQLSQLQRIKRSTKQLRQMTEEILDLARLDAGKLELQEEVVLFSSFVLRVLNSFNSLAESKNIAYKLLIDTPDDLRLKLDTQKVARIMNNLISNALKFTGRGGQVIVKASVSPAAFMLTIEDTGIGISKEDIKRIFDRYYQARHQKQLDNSGLGIGLAMCKELADFLGGHLEVKSEQGKGSIFFLSLPISIVEDKRVKHQTAVEENLKKKPQLTLLTPGSTKGKPVILIVEDNEDFSSYLMEILSPYFRLVHASNGLVALDILSQQEVDLILSDVMMPQMDGFELLKAVRSQPQQWGVPFILLTARSEQADQLYGLRLGVDTYLSKPFEENELIARIQSLLSNQQKRKAAFEASVTPLRESLDSSSASTPIPAGPSFDELWLIDLEKVLKNKIDNPHLKVGELASAMAMSERSFRDKLKICTGLKPNQYILQARLQLAYQLLEDKRYPTVAELTYAIGFQSKAYFSKTFKIRFGKLPSEMLKN